MKRPSYYMLLCAVAVLATFSVSGHLTVGPRPATEPEAPTAARTARTRPPAPAARVTGSVLDTMGYLLVGAEVSHHDAAVRTDGDGRFALAVPSAQAADLHIASNGYRGRFARARPLAREPVVVELEPEAPWDRPTPPPAEVAADVPAGVSCEGEAVDEAGGRVTSGLVVVAETGAMSSLDELGRYRIQLPAAGPVTLLLHAPAADGPGWYCSSGPFEPERRQGSAPGPQLVGQRAAVVRGTVRGADGTPIRGVPLQVVAGGIVRTIASGEGGVFRLGGLPPGRPCEVRAFSFRGDVGRRVAIELDAPIRDCELHLLAADERRLRVVTESGAPVARAFVTTSYDGLRRGVARADEDGWVRLRTVHDETRYEVRAGEDYRPLRLVGAPSDADQLVVALP